MIRVSAAIGILMALSPKRENDSARGSFLGKELPTGLRLAGGNGPQGLSSSRLKAQGIDRLHVCQPHNAAGD